MRATQADIAREVGLDISSVNKILNRVEGPVFHEQTKRRVFAAARKLKYERRFPTRQELKARIKSLEVGFHELLKHCGHGDGCLACTLAIKILVPPVAGEGKAAAHA